MRPSEVLLSSEPVSVEDMLSGKLQEVAEAQAEWHQNIMWTKTMYRS